MGKKSLFQPTAGSVKAKKAAETKKASTAKKTVETKKASGAKKAAEAKKAPAPKKAGGKKAAIKKSVALPPEVVVSSVEETGLPVPEPEKDMAPQKPGAVVPSVEQAPETDVVAETPAAPGGVSDVSSPAAEPVKDMTAAAPVVEPEPEKEVAAEATTVAVEEPAVAEAAPAVSGTSANEDTTEATTVSETAASPTDGVSPAANEPDQVMTARATETTAPVVEPEPEKEIAAEATVEAAEPVVVEAAPATAAISASAAAVEPAPVPEPVSAKASEPVCREVETSVPGMEAGAPMFEKDPLMKGRSVVSAVAGVCVLILILIMASASNSGRYYVKESKGAVKIWKGTFSPAGKERIMVLHGAHWNGPSRDSYSREEVFAFAARHYLEKALSLAESPGSDDFDRMVYYLGRIQAIVGEGESSEAAAVISQADKNIAEAQALRSSGEQASVSLAQEKLKSVGQALKGLVDGMVKDGGAPAGAEAGH